MNTRGCRREFLGFLDSQDFPGNLRFLGGRVFPTRDIVLHFHKLLPAKRVMPPWVRALLIIGFFCFELGESLVRSKDFPWRDQSTAGLTSLCAGSAFTL
jgi:hypothetical protein